LLTELYNRYAFENDIKSFNCDIVYSMIYLDIDDFRNFNNTYGHPAGDEVLKSCANIIKNCIRYSDIAYRYGGEELVVILCGCTKKDTVRIGQSIVENIHNHDNTPYSKMTISAGVASMPDDAQSFDQLIKASDSALLKAKNQGKDQLVVF
jgi:diguanylate cyclase